MIRVTIELTEDNGKTVPTEFQEKVNADLKGLIEVELGCTTEIQKGSTKETFTFSGEIVKMEHN